MDGSCSRMRRSPYLVVQVDQSDRATSVVKLKFISAGALLTPLPSERPEVAAALIKSENLSERRVPRLFE